MNTLPYRPSPYGAIFPNQEPPPLPKDPKQRYQLYLAWLKELHSKRTFSKMVPFIAWLKDPQFPTQTDE
jgi:hypothetical protein